MKRVNLDYNEHNAAKFRQQLYLESGVNERNCYQCGKCSGGCPAAFSMDYMPREIIRMVQLGLIDEALSSHTIWLCSNCITCYTRCPRSVNLPQLMDALRIKAQQKGMAAEKKISLFGQIFLDCVKRFGRVYEMGLIMIFNLKSRQPFKDVSHGPSMLLRGKIGLLPHRAENIETVRKIYERVREMEGENP